MRPRPTLGLAPALPGIALVVVIAWALLAVLLLTGTLVNAREINDTIPVINNQVSPIDDDLDNIRLAAETGRITAQIDDSAAPLTGQTDRIIASALSIDQSAARILGTAGAINRNAKEINGNVRAINGTVGSINGTVGSINSTVGSINDRVNSIEGNALAINSTVDSIGVRATSINGRVGSIFQRVGPVGATDGSIRGSVGSILRTFTVLAPETVSIDSGVAGINRRAKRTIIGVRSLKRDFVPISVFVGPGLLGEPGHGTAGPGTIHGHANSIDCSALINSAGRTEYCDR